MSEKQITGKTVLIITVSAFAVIIGVNITMAIFAVGTFPGLEVKNSYVASQEFDDRRAAQEGLGWIVDADYDGGEILMTFRDQDGQPIEPKEFSVLVGRTTESRDDVRPAFNGYGGKYAAPVELGRGKWMLQLTAVAEDGTPFQQRLELLIKG